jgi:SAM-dependent methyltransferase
MTSIPFSSRPYTPRHGAWPYTTADFARSDPSPDTVFYTPSRLVTHIDDHAIETLSKYYESALPPRGRILDLCSSWISHLPKTLEDRAAKGELEVIGAGMNAAELAQNSILVRRIVQDLNVEPSLPGDVGPLDGAACVVSIDYLTRPLEVLRSLRSALRPGAQVHLVVSNRCFPTKAVARWLRIGEEDRLQMVGDYLWFAGFRDVAIVTLCDGRDERGHRVDPLWVVTGRKSENEDAGGE